MARKKPVISVEDSLRTRLRWAEEKIEQLEEENRRLRGKLPGPNLDFLLEKMNKMKKPKWCSHCQKDSHSDSECWSTRVVEPGPVEQIFTPPALFAWNGELSEISKPKPTQVLSDNERCAICGADPSTCGCICLVGGPTSVTEMEKRNKENKE